MLGIGINVLAVICGGIFGTLISKKMNPHFADSMNKVLGICAMGMGINSIIHISNMPTVILSIVLGTSIGILLNLGDKIRYLGNLLIRPLSKLSVAGHTDLKQGDSAMLETAIVLFCFSSTGIYGCLDAGVTGSNTILLSKSILDLFTAMIIACNLGIVVALVALPQFVIFLVVFMLAKVIYPLTTPEIISDFKACGGFLLIATGFRIAKIKEFPITDMLPALLLVFPLSALRMMFC